MYSQARPRWVAAGLVAWLAAAPALADTAHFESPPVHPLELSPSGDRLLAAHTADHRLVVFDLTAVQPLRVAEIPVGLEPVTVRARDENEVWVVNHVSDSISIVDLTLGHVVRTLLVGDEPTDVIFAGSPRLAFVVVSQEDRIRVYDPASLDAPPVDIPLETSDPRALAASPDGGTVYVTALEGGNQTTTVPFDVVEALGGPPPPDPPLRADLPEPPRSALIVRWDGSAWRDETGGDWSQAIGFTMPDHDVLAVDASTLTVTGSFSDVGTAMFNVAVDATTGTLFVTNQEAMNEVRFEPNLRGRFVQSRLTRIDPVTGSVSPHHLNEHIDYTDPAGSGSERVLSLAIPLDLAVSGDGTAIYVAAFGSGKIAVLDAGGTVTRRIAVGEGPAGVALDEGRNRLYVLNRFSSTVSFVNLADDSSAERSLGFDPSADVVKQGRRFLYDGENSSAHGDLACASCHVFAGTDNLGWNLGDPQGDLIPVPPGQPLRLPDFHPMKGVMITQSLEGLTDTEPLHWRGDREDFQAFNGAFVTLMGREAPLDAGDMQLFEDFIQTIRYPSNPFRELDGGLPPTLEGADPQNGETLFLTASLDGGVQCVTCHTVPTGENGVIVPGAALLQDEAKVVPQLRNLYEKTRFDRAASVSVRGFGFTHDGAVHDLFTFLQFPGFTFDSDADRRDMAAFLLAFDTGTHPGVGAQWTMDGSNEVEGLGRIQTLQSLADVDLVGLVAKGRDANGQPRGWTYTGAGAWTPDKESEPATTLSALLAAAGPGTEITFTGVIEGREWRLGVDRDEDGHRDGDERDAGSDPGDPGSIPGATSVDDTRPAHSGPRLWLAGANPTRERSSLAYSLGRDGSVRIGVYDVRGRLVRELVTMPRHPRGVFDLVWDLRDQRRRRVPAGVYFVRMEAAERTRQVPVTVLR